MGREIRKVPANWEHPKKDNGDYQPIYNEYYGDALAEWLNEHKQWEDGTHPDIIEELSRKADYPFYAMWYGNPPDVDYYRHIKWNDSEADCFQIYETVSEGTPVSPVFQNKEALINWLIANGYSEKAAKGFAEAEWAPSGMMITGRTGFISDINTFDID